MRLTAVFSAPFLGGSELFNLEFLRRASERGAALDAIVPGPGALADALEELGASVEVLPVPTALTALSRFDRRLGGRAARAAGALRRYRADLKAALEAQTGPLCCMGFRSQLGVATTGATRSRPVCWVVHEVVPPGPFARLWARAARRCDVVYTYSAAAANQPALRDVRTEICDVRFDLAAFATVPPAVPVPARLGLVGDLFPLKNHLGFIEVVRLLRSRGHPVEGLLVGRDVSQTNPTADYSREVRAAISALHGRAKLVETRPDEMPARFAEMDLLLHLTTVPESFGRVCVEAMAAGRPVIAYGHGALPELVDDGRTGLLCTPGDLSAVADAVERLREDVPLFETLASGARQRALARWSAAVPGRTIGDALADFAASEAQRRSSSRI